MTIRKNRSRSQVDADIALATGFRRISLPKNLDDLGRSETTATPISRETLVTIVPITVPWLMGRGVKFLPNATCRQPLSITKAGSSLRRQLSSHSNGGALGLVENGIDKAAAEAWNFHPVLCAALDGAAGVCPKGIEGVSRRHRRSGGLHSRACSRARVRRFFRSLTVNGGPAISGSGFGHGEGCVAPAKKKKQHWRRILNGLDASARNPTSLVGLSRPSLGTHAATMATS